MTSANGTSLGVMKYDPFGECRESPPEIPTDRLITGQRYNDTGLYYYGARYYDPEIGRFISPDTIVPDFRNPQALNRYSYVINNPLKHTDSTGHFWDTIWDVIEIIADVIACIEDPSAKNFGFLGADVGLALVPFVPAGAGLAGRAGKKVLNIFDTGSTFFKVGDDVVGTAIKVTDDIVVYADDGYSSFKQLKKSLGSAGDDKEWHHIIEQCQIEKSNIPAEFIQNPGNALAVDESVHRKISGYYNSIQDFTGGLKVRDWLAGKSFEYQYLFGINKLADFGVMIK